MQMIFVSCLTNFEMLGPLVFVSAHCGKHSARKRNRLLPRAGFRPHFSLVFVVFALKRMKLHEHGSNCLCVAAETFVSSAVHFT